MWYLILGLVIALVLLFTYSQNKEHFNWEPRWKGPQSTDCYTEKPENCLNYANCGYCLGTGNKPPKCIPGDNDGPLFQERCPAWVHSNYYDRYIFDEKVTKITPSFAQFYNYEAWYPWPGYSMTL
jgi:hypothetical protein